MALHSVRAPPHLEDLFRNAERIVSDYFSHQKQSPSRGAIEIFDERYLLIRGAALSVEFFEVVRDLFDKDREEEADEFTRNVLFDLAHAMGRSDARSFHLKTGLRDARSKMSAGPSYFAHMGWALVSIEEDSVLRADDDCFLVYDHPYSFESDAWLRSQKGTRFPACIMNAGYSSGWCQESFGVDLVATEILCRARGDDRCRFVMSHPEHIERRVSEYLTTVPDLAVRAKNFKIPNLFVRKRLEDQLTRTQKELERRVQERTEELHQATDQLAREARERQAMEKRLLQAQKLEGLGRLAGGVAHDFNNLLTVINGCSELLVDDLDPDSDLANLAREIQRAGERAQSLTSQLLVFSRQQIIATRVLDMREVVGRLTHMLKRLIGEDVELQATLEDAKDQALVVANPGQLEQIILNLVVNARDAVQRGGSIRLSVDGIPTPAGFTGKSSPTGQCVRLRVTDDGQGMEEETAQHVFDPFFTTKDPGRGTGLGLAMVYGIVQQAGGSISVETAPGQGSTFTVLFPKATHQSPASPRLRPPRQEPLRCLDVLLVEDDDAVRGLLARGLRSRGHQVHPAANAEEALQLFDSAGDGIDLLLTDVVMPDRDGPELARELRKRRPDLPVLFMSGYTDDRVGRERLQEFDAQLLQKPLNIAELNQHIEQRFEELED